MRACPCNIIIIITLNNLFAIMGRTRFFGLVACLPWVYSAHTTIPSDCRYVRRRTIYSSTTAKTYQFQSTRTACSRDWIANRRVHWTDYNVCIFCIVFLVGICGRPYIGTAGGKTRGRVRKKPSSSALNFNSYIMIFRSYGK